MPSQRQLQLLSQGFGQLANASSQIQKVQEDRLLLEEKRKEIAEQRVSSNLNMSFRFLDHLSGIKDPKIRATTATKTIPIVNKFLRSAFPDVDYQIDPDIYKTDAGVNAYQTIKNLTGATPATPEETQSNQNELLNAFVTLGDGNLEKGMAVMNRLNAMNRRVKLPAGGEAPFGEVSELIKGGGSFQVSGTGEGELELTPKSEFGPRSRAILDTFNSIIQPQMKSLMQSRKGEKLSTQEVLQVQASAISTTAQQLGLSEDEVRSSIKNLSGGSGSVQQQLPTSEPASTPTPTPRSAVPKQPEQSRELFGSPLDPLGSESAKNLSTLSTQLTSVSRIGNTLEEIKKAGKESDMGFIRGKVYTLFSKYFNIVDTPLEKFNTMNEKEVINVLLEKSGKQTNNIERQAIKDFLVPGLIQNFEQAKIRLDVLRQGYADRTLSELSIALQRRQDVSNSLGLLRSIAPIATVENADQIYDFLALLNKFGMKENPQKVAFEKELIRSNPKVFNAVVEINNRITGQKP